MVFICDFFILISGDFGDVGGIVNFSVVLLCLVDMLIGLVLYIFDLLVMVMELFGLIIMFMNIIVFLIFMFFSFFGL